MKISKINFENHPVLKNLTLDLTKDNEPLDTIVLAGVNGTGKTSVLRYIYDYFEKVYWKNNNLKESLSFTFEAPFSKLFETEKYDIFNRFMAHHENYFKGLQEIAEDVAKYEEKKFPKIIYVSSDITYPIVEVKSTTFKFSYKFINVVNSTMIYNIASYIASKISMLRNSNDDMTGAEARDIITKEINGIFESLELNIKLVRLSRDEKSMPIFQNLSGDEFDINNLSSGEKQLFMRTLAIKMLEPENSIILIDEPEISLHPKWQQKIMKVYEGIGKNNQIIVATQSPFIIGGVKRESLILLNRTKDGIEAIYGADRFDTYGQPVQRILKDIMGLYSTREPEISAAIEELRKIVDDNKYDSGIYKEKYLYLRNLLGPDDIDLMLINMDVERRKKLGGNKNVQGQKD